MEQQPRQAPPIDRKVGYDPDLKLVKVLPSVDDAASSTNSVMPTSNAIVAFAGRPTPTVGPGAAPAPAPDAAADPGDGTTGKPHAANPPTYYLDGPGGFYGPSFADPAPWACGGAPRPR
ncbi:hypothetical protein [Streptomyces rubellomurinus]|uniref:Uncharacterized protein n=1 Tax=Streptomyces rubellomurinus (strain ATCC 31215) TaxID=359131 RepID=A0A0F2T8T5_STRR3|nr:hypothetical protein [Streptomyces rubellomurinus]KJS58836.1 hypothetical protein VM95_30810 [Streptomyces rubellomurinus]